MGGVSLCGQLWLMVAEGTVIRVEMATQGGIRIVG